MSRPAFSRDPARAILDTFAEPLNDMERSVAAVERWAHVVEVLGTCPDQIDPSAIYAVGLALRQCSAELSEQFELLYGLAHPGGS